MGAELSVGEKRRIQILEAVLAVISEDGIDAITHRRVGKAAGLSHGVVGYHFPTRDELIYNAVKFYLGPVDEGFQKYGWKPGERPSKRKIVDMMTQSIASELARRSYIRVEHELILYSTGKPQLQAVIREWEEEAIGSFASILESAGFANEKMLASILFNLARGFIVESIIRPKLTAADFNERLKFLMASSVFQSK